MRYTEWAAGGIHGGAPNGVDRVSCQAVIGHDAEAKSKQAPVGILLCLEWLWVFSLPGNSGFQQPFLLPIHEDLARLSSLLNPLVGDGAAKSRRGKMTGFVNGRRPSISATYSTRHEALFSDKRSDIAPIDSTRLPAPS